MFNVIGPLHRLHRTLLGSTNQCLTIKRKKSEGVIIDANFFILKRVQVEKGLRLYVKKCFESCILLSYVSRTLLISLISIILTLNDATIAEILFFVTEV